MAAYRPARIRAIDVGGSTITVVAGALDEESFRELIPVAEELLAGIEFEVVCRRGPTRGHDPGIRHRERRGIYG